MSTLLLTFLLLFGFLRIFAETGRERHDTLMERIHGTAIEFHEKYCDDEMEKEYRWMLHQEKHFEEVWQTLENAWETRRDEIENSSFRVKGIWHLLMDGVRKPFTFYSAPLNAKYNFPMVTEMYEMKRWGGLESYYNANWLRGVFCMMWIKGKIPRFEAKYEYQIITHCYNAESDLLMKPSFGDPSITKKPR